jgi:hypothetical protein
MSMYGKMSPYIRIVLGILVFSMAACAGGGSGENGTREILGKLGVPPKQPSQVSMNDASSEIIRVKETFAGLEDARKYCESYGGRLPQYKNGTVEGLGIPNKTIVDDPRLLRPGVTEYWTDTKYERDGLYFVVINRRFTVLQGGRGGRPNTKNATTFYLRGQEEINFLYSASVFCVR